MVWMEWHQLMSDKMLVKELNEFDEHLTTPIDPTKRNNLRKKLKHYKTRKLEQEFPAKNKGKPIILRDPGTICMHKILTHAPLIFVFHGSSF